MSLSQALATSVSGLRTTQSALSLVSANVANAETPGYVRKTLTQLTTSAAGTSVSVRFESINRELDRYLQRQLRVETSGGAYADLRAQFYSRLQQIYGDPGSVGTLENAYNDFTSSLQALSTTPESSSARSTVLSSAQVLTQYLNGMSNDIQGLRSDAELGLADAVSRANAAMAQIAAINRQLATSVSKDASSAVLADQRDYLIDQLSELMDIRVIQSDSNQISVFTASGIQLVGTEAATLNFTPQGMVTPQTLWSSNPAERTLGTLALTSPSGSVVDLLANKSIRSGQIAAFVEMRDAILVQAQSQLDAIAAAMTQALSTRSAAGTAVTAGAQAGFDIDVGALLPGNSVSLVYTDNSGPTQHRVTIVRVDDPTALPLSNSDTADAGDEVIGIDFSGGMASVVAQLNAAFGGTIDFSNPAGTTLRILDDGAPNLTDIDAVSAAWTVTGLSGGGTELPFFTDAGTPFSGAITSVGPQRLGFAGRITVNGSLLADPSLLVVYAPGIATGDPARPNFIYDQLTGASSTFSAETGIGSAASPFSGSLPSFLRQAISFQGENAINATNLAQGQDVVVNALRERMTDSSSVNIDEEMAHLLQLQTAYAANARVMTTVKEMLELLMRL